MRVTASAPTLVRALQFFALALALGLGACADVRWHKPGTDDTALALDIAACRKLTQDKFGGTSSLGLPNAGDPRFGAPFGPSQADLRMQEGQALGACMRAKGYGLISP
jgi:hypothetical protein